MLVFAWAVSETDQSYSTTRAVVYCSYYKVVKQLLLLRPFSQHSFNSQTNIFSIIVPAEYLLLVVIKISFQIFLRNEWCSPLLMPIFFPNSLIPLQADQRLEKRYSQHRQCIPVRRYEFPFPLPRYIPNSKYLKYDQNFLIWNCLLE